LACEGMRTTDREQAMIKKLYLAWLRWLGLVPPPVLGQVPISVGTGKPRLPAAHSSSGYAM